MSKVTFDESSLPHLCDLLMAAAYADEQLDGREVEAVKKFLTDLMKDGSALPDEFVARIEGFDPKKFDMVATAAGLGDLTAERKRAVLEMISELSESDEEIALDEDEFLRKTANAIGASAAQLEGLTVEVEIVAPSRPKPPPLPAKK